MTQRHLEGDSNRTASKFPCYLYILHCYAIAIYKDNKKNVKLDNGGAIKPDANLCGGENRRGTAYVCIT